MDPETPRETIEFLARSDCRIEILDVLREHGTCSRDALSERLDVVRTTLGRNLDALEERHLIRSDGRTYALTRVGELVAADTLELLETTGLAARVDPVVRRLPDNEFDVDLRALEDATVVESTMADPYAPAAAHERRLREADRARMVLPATGADPLESGVEQVEDGAVHEAVLSADLADAMRSSPDLGELYDRLVEADTVSIHRFDGDLSYFVGILDGVAQVGVHDERGIPAALLESDAEELRRWAVDRFESYTAKSERIA